MLLEDADHPLLLLGQVVLVQQRPEKCHCGFPGLQKDQCERRLHLGHGQACGFSLLTNLRACTMESAICSTENPFKPGARAATIRYKQHIPGALP